MLWLAITLPILAHKGIILQFYQVCMAEPLLPTNQLLKIKLIVWHHNGIESPDRDIHISFSSGFPPHTLSLSPLFMARKSL